jgi:hypothetical protein
MKNFLICVSLLLVGCAATPENLNRVAVAEAARIGPPSQRLSSFGRFELMPMELSAAISEDRGKVAEAQDLEGRLRAKLQPLLDQWNEKSGRGEPTLLVEPVLSSLRVVSGSARFWIGAFAGNSTVDMILKLTDKGSGNVIAQPRVVRSAEAMTGGWSVGRSDQNLLDYITAIAHEYLVSNY